jgi:20S proteasome subunit alpha 5
MYQNRSDYDRGVNTFSPEGRLFQIEYAIKAIELGSLAVAVRIGDGVLMGVEKRLTSPLLEKDTVEKIFEVDVHMGVAVSGLIADARTLVDIMRVECQNHRFVYDEALPPESMMKSLSDTMISFGEGRQRDDDAPKMSRPFGVSLLLASRTGGNTGAPVLYCIDPSGTYVEYKAHAIGNGSEGARNLLQERWSSDMSMEAGATLVARVLADTMEERANADNVEFAIVDNTGYRRIPRADIAQYLEKAAAEKAQEEQ